MGFSKYVHKELEIRGASKKARSVELFIFESTLMAFSLSALPQKEYKWRCRRF